MSIEIVESIITLVAVIIALLGSLFRYVDAPKKGYLLLCGYFMCALLSDYYWTVYTLVMGVNPDVSEFIAYLGWNIGYFVLLVLVFKTEKADCKRYFHALMLVPIPVNIVQFLLYIRFGGIFNNLWECAVNTAVACICIRSIMYYRANRKNGVHFPYLHTFILLYVISLFAMWTVSCFDWPSDLVNPYYYIELINYGLGIFLPWAAGRDYEAEGFVPRERGADEIRFQVRIQTLVCFILFGVCLGGYYMATSMRNVLPVDDRVSEVSNLIAMMLFGVSVFMELLIVAVLYVVALRYRNSREDKQETVSNKHNRFNLLITLLITLGLMIFSVIYNSKIYYDVSVNRIYETGEEKASATADEIENYLVLARSTLKVTADTVDLMIQNGESHDKILNYIVDETDNQKSEFDENFTGLYAYINGEYMDGAGWVPPKGYDPKVRQWYQSAVNANGAAVIVSPYIDAQTGSVVISICKMLSQKGTDGTYNVVGLDVIVNHVQDIAQQVNIGGKGYAMIANSDGMIVAHREAGHNGENIGELIGDDPFDTIKNAPGETLDATIDGEDYILFTSSIMDQWYVIIAVSRDELLEDVHSQQVVDIIVSLVIFALISLFYYLGYKNEQAYGHKMEEMKVSRQKQEYEAEVLRLEKLAADEANKAKSSFLADMSHEIRTPINAILGMNEMIIRETGETGVLEYAKNIKSSGRNLLQLVNSILDFSKIEDGKMEILPVRYRLGTLISYLVNSISEKANARNLDFVINIDPGLPSELYGDDTRIEQIILNLLTNAVKYTPEGGVTLTISERKRTEDKVLLYVEVRDTGIGIRESDMGRLFESFERLDETRNRNIEGTGLGISITTKLLDLMDSELMVESRYGEGSVFSFELWQKIENAEPIGEYKEKEADEDDIHSYHESFRAPDARVLIVDDTYMNIMVAVNLLKGTDIVTDTALSGPDAIKLAAENHYDVILLDQRMPGMDGTQTLKEIRSLANGMNNDTPVICLTADAVRGARERYLAEGFSDYLTKPVEGRDLERKLRAYLPKDKIIRNTVQAKSDGQLPETDNELLSGLNAAGFDTASALRYCRGDEEIYISVLREFYKQYISKRESLQEHLDLSEWNDYAIMLHSIKSTSGTIGAKKLSEQAAILEKAANEGDYATIKNEHVHTMAMYEQVCLAIKENLGITDEGDTASEEEVFEFAPYGE